MLEMQGTHRGQNLSNTRPVTLLQCCSNRKERVCLLCAPLRKQDEFSEGGGGSYINVA